MQHDPLLEALIEGFAVEAREICERMTRELLDLETAPDDAARARTFDSIARGLHTLKGSAATVGLEALSELAHRLEDLVAPWRKRNEVLPTAVVDAVLGVLDGFVARTAARAAGQTPAPVAELERLVDAVLAPAGDDDGQVITLTPSDEGLPWSGVEAAPVERLDGDDLWRVPARDILALVRELDGLRELRQRLELRVRDVESCLASFSVDPEATREGLSRLRAGLRADVEDAAVVVDSTEELLRGAATLQLRTLVDPLRRTVRDVARLLGRKVQLSAVGAESAVDRRAVEALRGPLMHLVRNAVDHGVEPPAVRESQGKHGEGVITIRFELRANALVATVEDDGRGLDLPRIREVAVSRGLVGALEADQLSAEKLRELIFVPGFSTAKDVTSTSGRGVGLDVVRSELRALDGEVSVESTAGQGTRFTLTVPVELSTAPLLVVRCREQELALPMTAVQTVQALEPSQLRGEADRLRLIVGDELLPVVHLGTQLGLDPAVRPPEGRPVLVVQVGTRRAAVVVDAIVGDRELVVRALPDEVRGLHAFQGAATLASGELVLVLRTEWLVEQETRVAPQVAGRRALVVDDSLTARAMHRSILESGGWSVHAAPGGREALERLASGRYDVVICDVSMPDMDGYDLTRVIRGRDDWRHLPVVLVSARDAATDRERGLGAGADAFVTKRDCAAGRLLAEVQGVIARRRG